MRIARLVNDRLRDLRRARAQTRDPNFVGFDKYRIHGAYHWDSLRTSEGYRAKVDLLLDRVQPSDRCLDLGCGDGAFAAALADRCREVVGVDADFDAIECATDRLKRAGVTNVRCVRGPVGSVAAMGLGQFDFVYSMDVIEHLPSPEQLLETAVTMVRDGGTVAIGTPLYISDDLISEYHVTEYTRTQLREMFTAYLPLLEEVVLPGTRKGGEMHAEEYWTGFGVCRGGVPSGL
ncbi:MAG: class I SAM-dependent methyltransferase [Actinomycetota bacterium]